MLGGALAFPIIAATLAWGIGTFKRNILLAAPDLATLNECLTHYDELQRDVGAQKPSRHEEIEAFETYIAGRFAPLVTNTVEWNNPITRAAILPPLREKAGRCPALAGAS